MHSLGPALKPFRLAQNFPKIIQIELVTEFWAFTGIQIRDNTLKADFGIIKKIKKIQGPDPELIFKDSDPDPRSS